MAGAALPGEPTEWQKKMLEAIGVGTAGVNAKLSRSDPMFDWRLVTAVRILCASGEKELGDLDSHQLGSLDASAPREVEVDTLQRDLVLIKRLHILVQYVHISLYF